MRRLIIALSAVSLLACGDSSGPAFSSAAGTWNLVTVNGSPLPYTAVNQGLYKLEILSDVLIASADGTFTGTSTFRETDNGVVMTTAQPNSGTWTQTNNSVTINSSDGTSSTVTISGDVITLSDIGFVSVYHRQ